MDFLDGYSNLPPLTAEQLNLLPQLGDMTATIVAGDAAHDLLENYCGSTVQDPLVSSQTGPWVTASHSKDHNRRFTGRHLTRKFQGQWLGPLRTPTRQTGTPSNCAPASIGKIIRPCPSSSAPRTKALLLVLSSPIHLTVPSPTRWRRGHPPSFRPSVEVSISPSFRPHRSILTDHEQFRTATGEITRADDLLQACFIQ